MNRGSRNCTRELWSGCAAGLLACSDVHRKVQGFAGPHVVRQVSTAKVRRCPEPEHIAADLCRGAAMSWEDCKVLMKNVIVKLTIKLNDCIEF